MANIKPTRTFAAATVGDIVQDLRQRVDWGVFEITAKVSDQVEVKNYIEATSVITGAKIRIPQRDTWLKLIKAAE